MALSLLGCLQRVHGSDPEVSLLSITTVNPSFQPVHTCFRCVELEKIEYVQVALNWGVRTVETLVGPNVKFPSKACNTSLREQSVPVGLSVEASNL